MPVERQTVKPVSYTHLDVYKRQEKNWAPIIHGDGDELRFMHRLGEVVDTDGVTLIKHDTGLAADHISGSSQVIPFESGWLLVSHEARNLPGSHLRYYYHRFAYFDRDFRLCKLSRPFVFEDKQIEFCAGLCWHPCLLYTSRCV